MFAFTIVHRNGGALPLLSITVKVSRVKMGLPGNKAMSVYLLAHDEPADAYSGQLRTGNFFAHKLLIKTVMRLFTAASNYSQLWLCSIDYVVMSKECNFF